MPTDSLKKSPSADGEKALRQDSIQLQSEYKAKYGRGIPAWLFQDVRIPTSKIVARIRSAIDNDDPFPSEEIEGMRVIGNRVYDAPTKK